MLGLDTMDMRLKCYDSFQQRFGNWRDILMTYKAYKSVPNKPQTVAQRTKEFNRAWIEFTTCVR